MIGQLITNLTAHDADELVTLDVDVRARVVITRIEYKELDLDDLTLSSKLLLRIREAATPFGLGGHSRRQPRVDQEGSFERDHRVFLGTARYVYVFKKPERREA